MCGIAGQVNVEAGQIDVAFIEGMLLALMHRGPDDSGIYTDAHAGLGHARLSIIDVGGGHQPMTNEDRSLWITYNGEIFNYVELMEELAGRGHRFASRCDTEVIIHAYEEWGEECVHRFNGQWAFALWDARRQRLFASRDRLGVRPFYYAQPKGTFLFASEVKALFQHPGVKRAIDLVGLDQIFTLWCPIAPRTAFQGVSQLPPGHSLSWQKGAVRTWRYWSLDYPEGFPDQAPRELEEALLELLVDATRIRLRSDVPVGAYLSGGLDSSLTTALVRRFTDASLMTFSLRFEDQEFDETGFQGQVARSLATANCAIRVSNAEIGAVFPRVIWHAEQPVLRTAPAPMFLLSRRVHELGYKVVVTGEGADETFGGYDIFKEAKIRRFWGACPQSQARAALLKRLYPYLGGLQGQSAAYLQAFFKVREGHLENPLFSHLPRWELTSKLKAFYSPQTREALAGYDPAEEVVAGLPERFSRWHPFCQAQYLESVHLLPGYILSAQGDRMAMGNSVEGRFPFLDHRVVEFASRLPPRFKMHGTREKAILKRVAREFLPQEVVRRPKQPYRAPDAASFFGAPGAPARFDFAEEALGPRAIAAAELFDPDAVGRLVQKARRGLLTGVKDNMALVGILSTQLLIDQFLHSHRPETIREYHSRADSAIC
jgi:asparagine synthase (glutamine-hydrolysing)